MARQMADKNKKVEAKRQEMLDFIARFFGKRLEIETGHEP